MIPIQVYGTIPEETLFARVSPTNQVAPAVARILQDVRTGGDSAVFAYTKQFDGAELDCLIVSPQEWQEAVEAVEPEFLEILTQAAANIRSFHSRQIRQGFLLAQEPGVVMGQKVSPIQNVAIYVPGGTAAYPSTVLMNAIPAKLAGCPRLSIATPPGRDGRVPAAILAAARIAGVDRVYKMGGAQAVAALAYGTQTVPRQDKIVGPGNAYVAEAKRQVFGQVAIDMVAGPSEILILADGKSSPSHLAADLLSQAEHDKQASAILVTDSEALARQVAQQLEVQLADLPRREIAQASLERNGRIILVPDLDTGMAVSNRFAPEHLELQVEDPFGWLPKVEHAGSVFLGRSCPEALGDYFAGPNHTLPTSGTARFSSPLSVDDFVKKTQFTYYSQDALEKVADSIDYFARKEGLAGHGRSAQIRKEAGL